MIKIPAIITVACAALFIQCNEPQQKTTATTGTSGTVVATKPETQTAIPSVKPFDVAYRLVGKDSIKQMLKGMDSSRKAILCLVNRIDNAHLVTLSKILVPNDLSGSIVQYSVFPQQVSFLKDVNKIIYFSYPAQQFAAYENGRLMRAGATNMGRKKDPTPTGLFFTNWKAEETKSTFNDEWDLKWNFNIQNKEGIGFHEYSMPGYPASHSCLRLQGEDAKFLYNWADEWVIKGTDNILAQGTPVIVFGQYPFGSPKPWLQLAQERHALDVNEQQLQTETQPYMGKITAEQQKRSTGSGKVK